MTNAQTYSIKEMLTKMDDRAVLDRAETNKKIDRMHTDLRDHIAVERVTDNENDNRIGSLENWRSFVMGAVWLLSGSGAITGLFFFIKSLL